MVNSYSKNKNGEEKLTDNFRVKEFACRDGSDAILIDSTLVAVLQIVRNRFNRPVTITSGYRTKSWNAKQGGVETSKHLLGKAADIVVSGVSPLQVFNYLNNVMQGWGGLILYRSEKFVHVDVRKNKYREVRD